MLSISCRYHHPIPITLKDGNRIVINIFNSFFVYLDKKKQNNRTLSQSNTQSESHEFLILILKGHLTCAIHFNQMIRFLVLKMITGEKLTLHFKLFVT